MMTNLSETPFNSEDVRRLLRRQLFAHYDHAHNARLDSGLYGQRWMAKTVFLSIKGRFGPAVHPRTWYREFRELALTATAYNFEQALKQLSHAVIGFNKAHRT